MASYINDLIEKVFSFTLDPTRATTERILLANVAEEIVSERVSQVRCPPHYLSPNAY